jgi:hypothetical protein
MKRRPYYIHWIGGILVILLINFLSSFLMFGFDLTADKRYTISDASIEYGAYCLLGW